MLVPYLPRYTVFIFSKLYATSVDFCRFFPLPSFETLTGSPFKVIRRGGDRWLKGDRRLAVETSSVRWIFSNRRASADLGSWLGKSLASVAVRGAPHFLSPLPRLSTEADFPWQGLAWTAGP
jgi:hypothetical protein